MPTQRLAMIAMALATLLGGVVSSAAAATFRVQTNVDAAADGSVTDGLCISTFLSVDTCTLRAALSEAQNTPGDDTIVLPARTYTLTLATPLFVNAGAGRTTINGAGAGSTIISGGNATQVMFMISGNPDIVMNGVTITGGNAAAGGGVRLNSGSSLTLNDSVVRDNTASATSNASGAGIYLFGGALTLNRTTVSGNLANATGTSGNAFGGGLYQGGGTLAVTNSTFSGNRAQNVVPGHTGGGHGGALFLNATTTIVSSTFVGNSASTGTAETLSAQGGSALTIRDSILSSAGGGQCGSLPGGAADYTGNIENGANCFPGGGNLRNTDPLLSPLGDAGGPTPTLRPVAGSPAIDAATCAGLATDQRGAPRPAGGACDIGAVEVGADLAAALSAPVPTASTVGVPFSIPLVVGNSGIDPAGTSSVAVPLPAGLAFAAGGSSAGCAVAGGVVRCPVAALARGAATVVNVMLTPTSPGVATGTATVSGGRPGDPNGANDAVTVTTTATAAAVTPVPRPLPRLTITTFSMSVRRFAATATARRSTPRRVVVRYAANDAATVTITFRRVIPGRLAARGRCVAPTRTNAGRRPCVRTVPAGSLTGSHGAGPKAVVFTGRIGRRTLPPGAYRAIASARAPDGRVASPRTLRFTIVPR